MKRTNVLTLALALGLVAIIGVSGTALAYPGSHGDLVSTLTEEQQAVLSKAAADFNKQAVGLQQQLRAKNSELDALYYSENADNAKAQKLLRDVADIEAKLYTAKMDYRKKLNDENIFTGNGFQHGRDFYRGMNQGHGRGHW